MLARKLKGASYTLMMTKISCVPKRHDEIDARESAWNGPRCRRWSCPYHRLVLSALGAASALCSGPVWASSFEGRLSAGPSYMSNDTKLQDSKGQGWSVQADAGLR